MVTSMTAQQAYAAINGMLDLQAGVISYDDIFHIVGIAFLLALPLLFLLGKPKKGNAPADLH